MTQLIQINVSYTCNRDCSYCYAKDLKEEYFNNMNPKDFEEILNWLKKNNINSLNLAGGEPTIHPQIGELLALAKNFNVTIFTNCLFKEPFLKNIDNAQRFLVNYNHKDTYTEEEYEQLHKNLETLKQKKKHITLAFNITKETTSCDYVIDAVKKYNVSSVNMDLVIPNSLKNNEYMSPAKFRESKDLFMRFFKKFKENNIPIRTTRPLPFCVFKDEIQENKGILYSTCSVGQGIIAINPDLSVFPCLSIFFKGPKITSFTNFNEAMSFYHEAISNLKWKRYLYPECDSCIYRLRKKCQGGCLCHKCFQFDAFKNKQYNILSQYDISKLDWFVEEVEGAIQYLDKIFGKPKQKIKISVFSNREDMLYCSGMYHMPEWVTAFAYKNTYYHHIGEQQLKNKCLSLSNPKLRGITHELGHIYIYQNRKGENIPVWLTEGFCEYLECDHKPDSELDLGLAKLIQEKKLMSFDDLSVKNPLYLLKHDPSPLNENIAFIQSSNFVKHLINKFGIEVIFELLMTDYLDFKQYFENLTNYSFANIEKEWKDSLGK